MATAKKVFKLPRGHKRTCFFYMYYSTIGTRNLFHFFITSLCSFLRRRKEEWSTSVLAALHYCKTKCRVWVRIEKIFDCVDSGSDPRLCAFEFDHHSSQALRLLTLWRDSDRSKDKKQITADGIQFTHFKGRHILYITGVQGQAVSADEMAAQESREHFVFWWQ